MSLAEVLAAYGPHGLKVIGRDKWRALCVAHGDRTPSLDIALGTDGKVLVICRSAGCRTDEIMGAVGLTEAALFDGERDSTVTESKPASLWPVRGTYTYHDAGGAPAYQVRRMVSEDSGAKTFRQYRAVGDSWLAGMEGVRKYLYQLPALVHANEGQTVYVVEGEKCADDVTALGLLATTSVGGAGKWLDEYSPCLKGLHVVVLPDNDEPGEKHAEQVAQSVAPHAASVRVVKLPGLSPKGDVSDWLRHGGNRSALEALCYGPVSTLDVFANEALRLTGERSERLADRKRTLAFGIPFLDDALLGIPPRSITLVGARTGGGKTQALTLVAMANAAAGKRVHYFALEGEEREIGRRLKYQIIARKHYGSPSCHVPIRYKDWRRGVIDSLVGRHEDAADREVAEKLKNLSVLYISKDFTAKDFERHLGKIGDATDLIILDHLHYVDHENRDENAGYKTMVKRIRTAALASGKPVIVAAHLRKGDRRTHSVMPEVEDFHGSSDIPKIATQAIMLAPDRQSAEVDTKLSPTFVQVVKDREDGGLIRYVGRMLYDVELDHYRPQYSVGYLSEGGTVFNDLPPDKMPFWARPKEIQEPHLRSVPTDERFSDDEDGRN